MVQVAVAAWYVSASNDADTDLLLHAHQHELASQALMLIAAATVQR